MPENINWYIWRPILCEPQLAKLREFQDGTYSINDLADMHEALDFKDEYVRILSKEK